MAEAAVVAAIGRELTHRRAWWFNVWGSGHGRNGLPDIVAVHRGVAIVIEAKSKTGRLRPLQAHELERARRAGATVVIARDVQAVRDALDAIDQQTIGEAA